MRGAKRAIKTTQPVNTQKYKSAPKRGGFDDGIALYDVAKPDTPAKISAASLSAHIMQTRKTCCFLMPCFSTKAFCAPMARISESPSEKPEKKALKEFILSLKFGVFWCFLNFVQHAYDKKLGEVNFATCGDFCKFVSQILAASRCGSRWVKFETEICEFNFKFDRKAIRRSIAR